MYERKWVKNLLTKSNFTINNSRASLFDAFPNPTRWRYSLDIFSYEFLLDEFWAHLDHLDIFGILYSIGNNTNCAPFPCVYEADDTDPPCSQSVSSSDDDDDEYGMID